MPRPTGPSDPNAQKLVGELKRKKAGFYSAVAMHLEKSRRRKGGVNVGKIERYANSGESVVVPGKVLGEGEITKSVSVYAHAFSGSAKEKITKAGGKCLPLEKILETTEKGRILI